MYALRFEEDLPPEMSLPEVRGREGARVRAAYQRVAQECGVRWGRREYDPRQWASADLPNRCLSSATACLYGVVHAALVSAGYSAALGFIHTGAPLSFVYDIADLYKLDLAVRIAFQVAAKPPKEPEREVRKRIHYDILLNNAAIYGDYRPTDTSLAYLRRMFDVNVHGQWLMARAVAPHLVRQRSGRIINVASIAAYLHQLGAFGDPENFSLGSYSYQHSKFSVIGLTRHMAGQLGQYGVTVNCIAPGLVLTEATQRQVPEPVQPMFAQMSGMASAKDQERILTSSYNTPQYVLVSAMDSMNDDALYTTDKINVPVLAILAQSPFWPADTEEFLKSLAPDLELHMWEGVDHFLHRVIIV